jgi:starvation-inducible DNA-binding protein
MRDDVTVALGPHMGPVQPPCEVLAPTSPAALGPQYKEEQMSSIKGALPKVAAAEVGGILQQLLANFADLALQAKQAHWHVTGPNFEPVHLQLDRIVADAHLWADAVAERSVALGHTVNGNSKVIGSTTGLPAMPTGYLAAHDAVAAMAERLGKVSLGARESLSRLDKLDPVTHDIVIGILADLEKHLWMLQAQLS